MRGPLFAAALIGGMLTAVGAAQAGDVAQRAILGFSADGGAFAFEEYGIQDGSGFPYSNIYIVDTATDEWVPRTPITVVRQTENATLVEARAHARDRAEALFEQYGIEEDVRPGRLLVSNPITEFTEPYAAEFWVSPSAARPLQPFRLLLDTDRAETGAGFCPEMAGDFHSFELVLTRGEIESSLHDDGGRVPASRGCALDYAISDVVYYTPPTGDAALAVLLSYTRIGFEGPDLRFLAVTTRLGREWLANAASPAG